MSVAVLFKAIKKGPCRGLFAYIRPVGWNGKYFKQEMVLANALRNFSSGYALLSAKSLSI
jgi:hypothetical protein